MYKVIKDTTVSGNGYSYKLNNKKSAEHLCQLLNKYEANCNINIEKVRQSVIMLQMDIRTLQATLDKLMEEVK